MIDEIKKHVKTLFKDKKVDLIIGYKRSDDGVGAGPYFLFKEEDADKLIWDAYCVYNLSNYLKEFPGKRIGIITKGCDVKSIIVLLAENQLKRENIIVIGLECAGVINEKKSSLDREASLRVGFNEKCRGCKPSTPSLYDILIKEKEQKNKLTGGDEDPYNSVRKFEAKSIQEKFKFWQNEFQRCIRCYACRQICPLCYCPKCVADQAMPAWFSKAVSLKGNFAWNVTRAMHLAGRCIDCGECERACPVGIPLRDMNKKIEKDVKELFGYKAGSSVEEKPLLSSFDKSDPEDWIR